MEVQLATGATKRAVFHITDGETIGNVLLDGHKVAVNGMQGSSYQSVKYVLLPLVAAATPDPVLESIFVKWSRSEAYEEATA